MWRHVVETSTECKERQRNKSDEKNDRYMKTERGAFMSDGSFVYVLPYILALSPYCGVYHVSSNFLFGVPWDASIAVIFLFAISFQADY